jgi:hypothetical protein
MTDGTGKIFYGWYIVVVCFVINFVVFGIAVNTFTVYVKRSPRPLPSQPSPWGSGRPSSAG